MLNNSQFARRHNNRSQHQVAVPNRRQPGVSTQTSTSYKEDMAIEK